MYHLVQNRERLKGARWHPLEEPVYQHQTRFHGHGWVGLCRASSSDLASTSRRSPAKQDSPVLVLVEPRAGQGRGGATQRLWQRLRPGTPARCSGASACRPAACGKMRGVAAAAERRGMRGSGELGLGLGKEFHAKSFAAVFWKMTRIANFCLLDVQINFTWRCYTWNIWTRVLYTTPRCDCGLISVNVKSVFAK